MRLVQARNLAAPSELIPALSIRRANLIGNQLYFLVLYIVFFNPSRRINSILRGCLEVLAKRIVSLDGFGILGVASEIQSLASISIYESNIIIIVIQLKLVYNTNAVCLCGYSLCSQIHSYKVMSP